MQRSVGCERDERYRTGTLDRVLELPLMQRARSGNAAGKNLAALGDELLQRLDVLVVDVLELLDAELADALAAVEELLLAALLSTGTGVATIAAAGTSAHARTTG